jgi:hypothetical protein
MLKFHIEMLDSRQYKAGNFSRDRKKQEGTNYEH